MKSKVTLLASWNIGGFPFVKATFNNRGIKLPVERNGRYFEPEQIMDFYARYSKDGRRRPAPLGKDPVDALSGFKSTEADHAREQQGCFRSTYRKRLAQATNLPHVQNSSRQT